MMRRYLISSSVLHFSVLAVVLFSPWFRSGSPYLMIEGFDYMGTGGGGGGKAGPKPTDMGQVVPAPVKVPVPAKPAPKQKTTRAEETWAVKDAKKPAPTDAKKDLEGVERGEKTQQETSNVIRRGVSPTETAGEGSFDYGVEGPGTGKGVGIGFGDGQGGGFPFGSYLRILRQRIWAEWTQSAVLGTNRSCIVGLTVHRGGEVDDIRLEKPSGDSFYDTVALRAVRNSSPLPPLPTGYPKSEQRFRIQFRLLD